MVDFPGDPLVKTLHSQCRGPEFDPWLGFFFCFLVCVFLFFCFFVFLVAKMVKNLPAMQETQVQSLGQEDPLEKRMTTHSSILAWRIPWAEEPGKLQSCGVAKIWTRLSD